MHATFILYGKRSEVELLFRDMEAQKFLWKMWKGKKVQHIYVGGAIRILPFGIYEYVFPKEHKDLVLATLKFANQGQAYASSKHGKISYAKIIGAVRMKLLRKLAGCEKTPEFKDNRTLPWIRQNVKIIPLGVRSDPDMVEHMGEFMGWTHEAL